MAKFQKTCLAGAILASTLILPFASPMEVQAIPNDFASQYQQIAPLRQQQTRWVASTTIVYFGTSNGTAVWGQITAGATINVLSASPVNGRWEATIQTGPGDNGHGGRTVWFNDAAFNFMWMVGI